MAIVGAVLTWWPVTEGWDVDTYVPDNGHVFIYDSGWQDFAEWIWFAEAALLSLAAFLMVVARRRNYLPTIGMLTLLAIGVVGASLCLVGHVNTSASYRAMIGFLVNALCALGLSRIALMRDRNTAAELNRLDHELHVAAGDLIDERPPSDNPPTIRL